MIEFPRVGRGVTRRVEPDGQLATVRKQLVVTERWDDRVEEWRSKQRPLPTWSEAVRILVERSLDAEDGDNFVERWIERKVVNDPQWWDSGIDEWTENHVARCLEEAGQAGMRLGHRAFDRHELTDRIQQAIENVFDPGAGHRD